MISLCIPIYNRSTMVVEAFSQVMHNSTITEIVLVDDYSDDSQYEKLYKLVAELNNNKIKLYRNNHNKKAFLNKIECVKNAKNNWIVLLDSDNIIIPEYLDSIPKDLNVHTFYLPSRAICESENLNYTGYSGLDVDLNLFKQMSLDDSPTIQCLLNTGNFLVNKETYLQSITPGDLSVDCFALDPYYQIYLGFKNIKGFNLHVTEGMQYYHRLHKGNHGESTSYYEANSQKSGEFHSFLKNKICNL